MKTKDKIIHAAIELFNLQGEQNVTTNHIAAHLGMSPGNLYYHFRNKEEIIRALFQRLFDTWDNGLPFPHDHQPTLADLKTIIETNYQIIWQYRFAYRELVALLRQDAELRKNFLTVRQRGFNGFHELIHTFSDAGIIHLPDDPKAIHELQEIVWLISEFWLTNLEVNGRSVNKGEMQNGVKLMLRVLQPYLV